VTPLVSVIIPVHNAVQYLPEAVDSVLSQTYKSLEVIVVDDGSTSEVGDSLKRTDRRLKVLRRASNGGPSAARNDGWKLHADPGAEYVAFLDADDSWDPDKIGAQVAVLQADPTCVAIGSLMRYVSSAGRTLGVAGHDLDRHELADVARGELQPFQLSSMLVRRSALSAIGGFDEPLGLLGSEDLDFIARLAAVGSIAMVPTVLGAYRVHPASAMAQHRLRINRAARFVRRRLAARRRGADLTWEQFVATEAYSWSDRRQDTVERCYRRAALWFAERRIAAAFGYGVLAVAINPTYTLRRASRQVLGRGRLSSARRHG
jgi:glycosyltransferase involved in cell wall biosynthesis